MACISASFSSRPSNSSWAGISSNFLLPSITRLTQALRHRSRQMLSATLSSQLFSLPSLSSGWLSISRTKTSCVTSSARLRSPR